MKNDYKIINDVVVIYLKRRKGVTLECYVDIDDFEKVNKYTWHSGYAKTIKDYYVVTTIYKGMINDKPKYEILYMHRLIMGAIKNECIDHNNHRGLDNKKENLIKTTYELNLRKRKSKNNNNTSGYRNVSWNNSYNKWTIQLQIDGKNTILKMFDDVHEAGKFAEEMRKKYYGKFAGAS